MNNFKDLPADKDTRIIKQSEIQINNIPALDQKWNFDGIIGSSLIFNTIDVDKFSDTELLDVIKEHSEIKINGSVTFSDKNGYRFVNYNFEAT